MIRRKRILRLGISLLLLGTLLLSGCSAFHEEKPEPSMKEAADSTAKDYGEESGTHSDDAQKSSQEEPTDLVEVLLAKMTTEEKVAQLFILRPDALDPQLDSAQISDANTEGVTEVSDAMRAQLTEYPVGGLVLFRKNIEDPEQITEFLAELEQVSEVPLFLAVDEEGGAVARLANHSAFDLPKYTNAQAVGSSGDAEQAVEMGSTIGAYLREYGFNMDFAPVADVNTNPDNPIIGTRAFSSDGETAAIMAASMAEGLKQQGIIPTFKHFPGHGDTAEDSHSGLAVSYKSQEEMEQCEWLPYQNLSDKDCVMVGHIAVPEITKDLTPASLSYQIVSVVLRQQLGFDGVVITDSLEMQAVTDTYGSGEAAVTAILSGCDVLLTPYDFQEAFVAVCDAVEDGRISETRLDESVSRILTLKLTYGLIS